MVDEEIFASKFMTEFIAEALSEDKMKLKLKFSARNIAEDSLLISIMPFCKLTMPLRLLGR